MLHDGQAATEMALEPIGGTGSPAQPPADSGALALTERRARLLAAATREAEHQLVALREELAGIVESGIAVVVEGSDPDGTSAFERAQLETLIAVTESRLAELRAATERLLDGTYGTCERCATQIPPERLTARPTARTCIDCARSS